MKTLSTLLLLLLVVPASATHLLGGYIQARSITGLQYEIKVLVYYDGQYGAEAASQATEFLLCTGDGATIKLPRVQVDIVNKNSPNDVSNVYTRNVYRINYTYSGPGVYQLTAWQENRTIANNLVNADGQIFSVNTRLVIQNGKANSTPVINLAPDAFVAYINQQKKITLAATDEDNDSLTLVLIKPLIGLKNNVCYPINATGYNYPNELTRRGTFKADSRDGAIVWNAPTSAGRYTFAVKVLEWRDGALVGETALDMTISVFDKPGGTDPIPPYEPVVENNFNGQLVLGFDDTPAIGLTLAAFPNPVTDQFLATLFTRRSTRANFQLLNTSGQVIQEIKSGKQQTRHEETFVIGQLPAGVYFLRAEANGQVLLRKVVKQ